MTEAGGGYTKTFKRDTKGWKDGDSIPVKEGQNIPIIVGKGGAAPYTAGQKVLGNPGGYSEFMDSRYRAEGSSYESIECGGNGGSGGGAYPGNGGSDGSDAYSNEENIEYQGRGQGHTTRDFGEPDGKRNAGGGSGQSNGSYCMGGASDYTEGSGANGGIRGATSGYPGRGGGGYGGGGGAYRGWATYGGAGGDGTVLIRYRAYEE